MRLGRLAAAVLFLVFGFVGAARADIYVNNFTAFGTVENCSYGASIDGEYAAVIDDEGPASLNLYNFTTRTLTRIAVQEGVRVRGASLRKMKIAYLEGDYWTGNRISVYDILTRQVTETGVTTAAQWDSYRPMRFFDGEHVAFTDQTDNHVKYYSLTTGGVTDTGRVGWSPTIDGNMIAFNEGPQWSSSYNIAVYNLLTGETRILDAGFGAVIAGGIIAYIVPEGWRSGEVKYYRLESGAVYSTGISNVNVISTDGRRIAIAPQIGSIKIYDISTAKVIDTGQWPCTGGEPCWLEIAGRYVAYERWEGSFTVSTDAGEVVIPEEDLNEDGFLGQDCAGGWFISEVYDSPAAAIDALIKDLSSLNISEGVKISLESKLAAALKVLEDFNERNDVAAVNIILAFVVEIEAQRGITIQNLNADRLHGAAEGVLSLI